MHEFISLEEICRTFIFIISQIEYRLIFMFYSYVHSQYRAHIDFFCSLFQIIIKAVHMPNLIHNTSNGPVEFGPVFNRDFLLEVYNLQQGIKGEI